MVVPVLMGTARSRFWPFVKAALRTAAAAARGEDRAGLDIALTIRLAAGA